MAEAQAASGQRVMIVEDDETTIVLLQYYLEREGLEVTVARDGRQALRHVEEDEPPSLAILDVLLPGYDGYQLVRQIRCRREWRTVPILIVSGHSDPQEVSRLLAAGANDYVAKPFQPADL